MKTLSAVRSLAGLLSLALIQPLLAQGSAHNRLAGFRSDSARAVVADTVNPRARHAVDLGEAPAATPLQPMTLRFNLSTAQQTSLASLERDQQNPNSASFHQWLTPESYGAQFGLSEADLATVTSWLAGQGFNGISVARSRSFVTFSGTAGQVRTAFQTAIHKVAADGEEHLANLEDPALPAALAGVVSGVTGLNDFHLQPRVQARTVAAPQFTSSVSGSHFIAPGDFYTIYNLNPQLNASINGSGITIGVMGQTDISLADAAAFRSASGLPANPPVVKLYGTDPGTTSGDILEAMLDVEWAGAVAPSATVLYVNSTDVIGGSLTAAIDNNLAPILTVSYGNCEAGFGSANVVVYNQLFRQATVQGQTVLGPSGDSGATDCDYQVATARQGLAVDFPASSPYVTGIGGTMFNENGGLYFSTANGAFQGSALSYIPEAVWNESSSSGLGAAGGGVSAVFAKPTWQVGTGVPNDARRDVPDISFNAASGHDGYLFCAQNFCTNGFRNASNNLDVVGGTSVSTPAFAGIMALLEQKIKNRVGNANPTIYALANSTYASTVFHDVTTGNNNSPCLAGSTGCTAASIGYSAGTGYDLATGWGSLDVNNFITDWPLVASSPLLTGTASAYNASTTTATPSATRFTSATPITVVVKVASATAGLTTVPAGTVQLLIDEATIAATGTLANGTVTLTVAAGAFSSGTHYVTALYLGNSVFAGSAFNFTVDVTSVSAVDFTLSPATASVTTATGTNAPGVTYTVTPLNGFVGSVSFTASEASGTLNATGGFTPPTVNITSTGSGSTVFTLSAYVSKATQGTGQVKFGSSTQAWNSALPQRPMPRHSMPQHIEGREMAGGGIALAGLLLLMLPRGRRRFGALLALVLSVGMLSLAGCGDKGAADQSVLQTNTTPGTYTVLVTATGISSGGAVISHNATLTFIVK